MLDSLHRPERPTQRVDRTLDDAFAQLRDAWLRETAHLSSLTARINHHAYQSIIALGPPALPLLLSELDQRPAQWAPALRAISGEDPVPADARGNLRLEREAWLAWGQRNQLY